MKKTNVKFELADDIFSFSCV